MSEITLTTEDLPEIKDWQEGETYRVMMELTPTQITEDEATFEVASVKAMPMKSMSKSEGQMEPEEEMGRGGTRERVIERIGEKAKEA